MTITFSSFLFEGSVTEAEAWVRFVKLDVSSTYRMFFIFQTVPPKLGTAR